MTGSSEIFDKIYDLKKRIQSLEWDIPRLKEGELKEKKKKILEDCKKELVEIKSIHTQT